MTRIEAHATTKAMAEFNNTSPTGDFILVLHSTERMNCRLHTQCLQWVESGRSHLGGFKGNFGLGLKPHVVEHSCHLRQKVADQWRRVFDYHSERWRHLVDVTVAEALL
jgi:hypothetical protein